jgi:hypothetical protein
MAKKTDLALGSWEAACLLGVHWTQPKRMSEKGLLTARTLRSPIHSDPERVFSVYSMLECEENFAEYEAAMESGGTGKRARTAVEERPAMLKKLAAVTHQITFGDAISTGEAGEILGVHWTFPPRLALAGKIVGRVLANGRNRNSRCWVFSRASCEANVSLARRLEANGTKRGRKRKPS